MRRLLFAGLLFAALAAAQETDHLVFFQQAIPPPPPSASGLSAASTNSTFQYVAGQMVSSGVKGSPYSADSIIESTQVLSDGNRIVNKNTTKLFRDGEGRERREMSLGPDGATQMIMISDPVAGVSYTLHPAEKIADKMATFSARQAGEMLPPPVMVRDALPMAAGRAGVAMSGAPGMMIRTQVRVAAPSGTTNESVSAEDLGSRVVEGVMATGTRHKTTIPAGQIGNERPIDTSTETWFSPDLKMTVLSETSDPRMGKTVMKLTNINRAEPTRTLFEVPPGYTVREGPALNRTVPAARWVEAVPAEKQ